MTVIKYYAPDGQESLQNLLINAGYKKGKSESDGGFYNQIHYFSKNNVLIRLGINRDEFFCDVMHKDEWIPYWTFPEIKDEKNPENVVLFIAKI